MLGGLALLFGGVLAPKAHALAAAAEADDAQVYSVVEAEEIGDGADIAATCECKADIDKDGDVTPVDRNILDGCVFVDPTDPFCDNADVNCDGALDPADLDAWDCVFENPTLPPAECCGKTVEDVCIYRIQCIDGPCTTCPVRNPGLICAGAPCPGQTCSTGYSSTCGADCCVELVWTGECRPPAGEPPCPQENNPCPCDPAEGACCAADGTCTNGPESKCQGQYMGDGSTCLGDEACCLGDGTCVDGMDALCCEKQGGTPQGAGSLCQPLEPCCLPPNKECVMMEPNCCIKLGGSPNGCTPGTTCCITDDQCPSQKCRPGVCVDGACDLLPKQPGCCTSDAQCRKCEFCDTGSNSCIPTTAPCCETDADCLGKCDICDTATNTCVKGVPNCCDSDAQCPDTKCRIGFCDFSTNTCQLGQKAPGCCESDSQCPSTKCRVGFCDTIENLCKLRDKEPPECCETDAQCVQFGTKCRPGLCDLTINRCFTGPKVPDCCETDGQCPSTKCRIGFCDLQTNTCRLEPKDPPDCCESDAQCTGKCDICDLDTNTCVKGVPNCCDSDAQCANFGTKCRPGLCDFDTNTCFTGPKVPNCCESDAQCTGKCDICDLDTNTCVKGVPNCCDSDAQCPDTKCRIGFCDFSTNTCRLGDKFPGCCETDAQCPGTKCRAGLCDFLTNTCFLGDKAPGCCESDTQCPGTKCRAGFCHLDSNTCQLGPKAPGCCESDAQCPGCQICVNNACVDDQGLCFGCEDCVNGVCVDNQAKCPGCQDCLGGFCFDEQAKCIGCQDCVNAVCVPDDTKCGKCEVCDPATKSCIKAVPNCCTGDAQCGKCQTCDLLTNTCVKNVPNCCSANAQCPGTKCRPGVCDLVTNTCTLGPKVPGCCTSDAQCPPGSVCDLITNSCITIEKFPKWSQRPGGDGEDVASNLGWPNFDPNVIVADDWTSDGRVITAVRWWGSIIKNPDPKACEPEGSDCGAVVGECVCTTRIDGTLNCADAASLANPTGTCQDDSQCVPPSKCFGQPGTLGVCAVNCGDPPPDPKVCPEKGLTCGDPGTNCICETRFDGTLNCADAGDYFSTPPIHGFCINGDADCPTGTKCFTNRADGPVCAHNCGDHPPDPKVCDAPGDSPFCTAAWSKCGGATDDCHCGRHAPTGLEVDGAGVCLDKDQFADCAPMVQCEGQGDQLCNTVLPGAKCVFDECCQWVCAYNCGETPDPKLCSPLGSDCGIPGVNCFCSERIDGSQNCADIDDLALCNFPCASDADCDVANGVKCFVDPNGINPGCCTRNCSGFAGRPEDKTVRDGRPGVDQQRQTPTVGLDAEPVPDTSPQPRTDRTTDDPEAVSDPDGWFISMHQPVGICNGGPNDGGPCADDADCLGFSCEGSLDPVNQAPALAIYFCDVDAVQRIQTTLPSCDGHPVIEYQVWLDDCCLVQSNPDTRYDPPLVVATKEGFKEQNCDQYFLSIQAVVGVKFFQDPDTLECIQEKTNRFTDADFWGWHTSPRVCEKGDNQKPKDAFQSSVKLGATGKPLTGPWSPATTVCSAPNMAFELLTPEPPIMGKEDLNGNCVPDACECPIADPPKAVAAATHAAQAKNRYLSITPNNPGKMTALRVRLTASSIYPNAVGSEWWVGAPREICENSGQGPAIPPANCGPAPGVPKRTMWWSQLSCNQVCLDWTAFFDIAGNPLDVLHISGRDVATGSVYEIRAVDCACDKSDPANYSAPLAVSTSLWGDTTHNPPAACPHVPPNGFPVDLIPDCTSVVQKFSNDPCALLKSRADLEPHGTDQVINITDVAECVNAFSGGGYPYVKPVGCP